jgi:hypothetical protein
MSTRSLNAERMGQGVLEGLRGAIERGESERRAATYERSAQSFATTRVVTADQSRLREGELGKVVRPVVERRRHDVVLCMCMRAARARVDAEGQ